MKKYLILFGAMLLAMSGMGDTWTDPETGIKWTYTISGGEASVGDGNSSSTAVPTSTKDAITIPPMLGEYPVMSIGNYAFYSCSELTSVTIPLSVTNIGHAAFSGCSGLKSINVDSGNANYCSVDGVLYNKSRSELICFPAEKSGNFTILSSVTSIGYCAFEGCSGLESVTIPPSVTSIGIGTFSHCSVLKSVTIPSSVTNIDEQTFSFCSGLTNVTISHSVTNIGSCAFYGCSGLANVTIPSSVISIGDWTFSECSGFTSVAIPSSVTSIGIGAFSYCGGLEEFTVETGNAYYKSEDGLLLSKDGQILIAGVNGDVMIPSSVTSIGIEAFYGCSGLTSVTIPSSVTSIGSSAFHGCSGLESVAIPLSVMNIGDLAFCECSGLTSVTIPLSVTSIGRSAFSGCRGLESVTIPSSVTSIGYEAFGRCSGLTSVTIPSSVTSIGDYAFGWCDNLDTIVFCGMPPDGVGDVGLKKDIALRYNSLYSAEWAQVVSDYGFTNALPYTPLPDGGPYKETIDGVEWMYTISGGEASVGGGSWSSPAVPTSTTGAITIPSTLGECPVTSIGDYAFYSCHGLTSVTIPLSVKSISSYAFHSCSGLESVTIPLSVASIGQSAFSGCRGLTSVTIPSSVTSIGDGAFCDCRGLTSVTIPSSVTSIGKDAFYGCYGLTSVTIPSSVTSIGDYAFMYCSGLTSVTIPSSVTSIGNYAFMYCSGLTSVTIPSSVTSIGNYAFSSCIGLRSVMILEGVISIGNGAFYYCSGLTSVTIPSSVTNLGSSAFSYCGGLTSLTIPSSVTSIGNAAFYNCSGLTSVTIREGVTSIGNGAFRGCSGLQSVMIPEGVTNIGEYAFTDCKMLAKVVMPSTLANVDNTVFCGCVRLMRVDVAKDNPSYKSVNGLLLTKDGKTVIRGINGSVTIPSSVTNILDGAFAECLDVTALVVEAEGIDFGSVFGHCTKLKTVQTKSYLNMPASVEHVTLGSGIKRIDEEMFGSDAALQSIDIDGGVTSVCEFAFNSCTNLVRAIIPPCVTNMGRTFGDACASIRSVRIPPSATEIGDSMFQGFSALVELVSPISIRSIGDHAFENCSSLESYFLATNTTSVGECAFAGCSSLAAVMIPSNVIAIATNAFEHGEYSRRRYYVDAGDRERVESLVTQSGYVGICDFIEVYAETIEGISYVFTTNDDGVKIVKAINTTTNTMVDVCLPTTLGGMPVTELEDNIFKYCSWVSSVNVGEGVLRIGAYAFAYCECLMRVELPTSLQSLNNDVFSGDYATVVSLAGSCPKYYRSSGIQEVADVDFPSDGTYPLASDIYKDAYDVYSSCALIIHGVNGETYTQWEVELEPGGKVDFTGANRLSIAFSSSYWDTSIRYIKPGEYQTTYRHYWGNANYRTTIVRVKGEYPNSFITRKVNPAYEGTGYSSDTWWYQYYTEGTLVSRDDCKCGDVIAITPADGTCPWIGYGLAYQYGGYANYLDDVYYFRIPTYDSSYDKYGAYVRMNFKIADTIYTARSERSPAIITYHLGYPGGDRNLCVRVGTEEALRDPWQEEWYDIKDFEDSEPRYSGFCASEYYLHRYYAGWDVRAGWSFVGWKNEDGDVVEPNAYCPSEGETKDFFAVYQLTTNTITYFSALSQPTNNPVSYTAEDEVILQSLDNLPGWTFLGWQYQGEYVDRFPIGTIGDLVVSAKWERVYNDVAFGLGSYGTRTGGGALRQSVEWEQLSVVPEFAVAAGWRFTGWDGDVTAPITNATTFAARYEPIVYGIEYADTRLVGHDNPHDYTVTNALTFSSLDNVPGWDFVGWEPSGIAVGTTGDLVVSAKWERVYHAIDVRTVHGTAKGGGSYEYGSVVTLCASDAVWDGPLTNYVCLGSSSFLPLTNEVQVVMTNGVSMAWDVWQTNYLFRTAANPTGAFYEYGSEVEQTAEAEPGYRFYKWIGDVNGNAYENPKTFVMTQARYVEPVFVEEKVATPSISIPNGTVLSNRSEYATITCATPSATIYYTLDGTMPSRANGMKYEDGGFTVNQNSLIKAIAVKDGSDDSEVASSAIVYLAAGETLPKITITPDTSVQQKEMIYVTFGAVSIPGLDVERRYTTDGSQPTATSTLYSGKFLLPMNETRFVKAAMFVNEVRVGEISSVRYAPSIADFIVKHGEGCGAVTIENEAVRPWTVDANTISPDGNPSMRSGWTQDGSKMYVYFNGDGVIEFNWKSSCEAGSYPEYDLYVDHLECRLDGYRVAWLDGETDWTNVVISVTTKGEHLMEIVYYKDDADDDPYPGEDCGWISDVKFSYAAYINFVAGPNSKGAQPEGIVSSAGYSVPLPGCGDLKYAKHEFVGWRYGDDVYAEGELLLVDAQEMTLTPVWAEKHLTVPVIDVAAEYDEESTVVTITNAEGVAIYYTTDDSKPTAKSARYTGPFHVVGTATIKAIALDEDWFDSPIASETTTRSWTTLEDCLNAKEFTLATGGDRNWIGNVEDDGVKSAMLNPGETSWLSATFSGAGVVEWWSRSSTTGWTRCTEVFPTLGEHVLRWEGSDLWIKGLKFTPGALAMFVSNEPIVGEMPDEIYSAPGYEISMPSFDGFSRENYTFNGWTDGVKIYHPDEIYTMTGDVTFVVNWSANRIQTPKIIVDSWYETETTTVKITVKGKHGAIYYTLDGSTPTRESLVYAGAFDVAGSCTIKAMSVCDNYFDSDVGEASTVRAPWTINECLNNTNLVFSIGGSTNWVRCVDASADGYCMQSGSIEDDQETWIDASVTGSGVLNFSCKVSSEGYYRGIPLDYIDCKVDDAQVFVLAGITEWTNVTVKVSGDGEHTIRWRYFKDAFQDPVVCDDCAWLDHVTWIPLSADAIPELDEAATAQDVAAALAGSADARLAECITNASSYNAYRDWAENVKTADGTEKAGSQAVKDSPNAWLSFAIGSSSLISELPTSDDVKVDSFVPASEAGKFDFTVSIDGINVSKDALKENLKRVFGLEGGATLQDMSDDKVDITFGTPENGKVKFTAGPKDSSQKTFFMKVKMKP